MPHQCTNCGRTFADGSKEMLSGCPDCSGTKFQFSPDGFDDETPTPEPPERPDDRVARTVGNAAATVRDLVSGSAGPDATRAGPPQDPPANPPDSGSTADSDDIIVAESTSTQEDTAQADARSQLAGVDDLPESGEDDPSAGDSVGVDGDSVDVDRDSVDVDEERSPPGDPPSSADDVADASGDAGSRSGRTVAAEPDEETAERPDLAQLREELNDQFESIRIVERGQYELNLMELYDRDEVIVALQEDGRYSIRVPEAIGDADV